MVAAVLACAFAGEADARTPILGKPRTTVAAAQSWARAHGATRTFVRLAPLYWQLAPARGIRPELAYAQAAKETGFGRFGGVLDASFRNPCGLKRTAGGPNHARWAHRRFRSWRAGVTAHLDHLALYAGARGYPKRRTPDPRHFRFLHGSAPTVERLGGRWAPSRSYGREVIRLATGIPRRAKPKPRPEPREPIRPSLAEGTRI